MYSVGLAFLFSLNLQPSVPITEFGSKASYHHYHKVDRVFVTSRLEHQSVHIICKETGHDFVAKFSRALQYCRITFLEKTKNQTVYTGDGIDVKGVICDFKLKVIQQGKASMSSRSSRDVHFLDKLANDSRFKDSEWRIEGTVIGFGVNDDLRTVIVTSTGRILYMMAGIHHMKAGTLPWPVPKSVIVKPKGRTVEIYDRFVPLKPICVLDEYFKPTFPTEK